MGWLFVVVMAVMLVLGFAKKGIYSSKLGFNVVVVGDSGVALVLLRPEEGIMTLVKLPENLSVKISGSNAIYPLSSLWKYSLAERNTYKVVTSSLSETIGVILPRVIKVKGDPIPENILGSLHKINLMTDLSLRDRILLRRDLVVSVSSKKILEIEIPKSALNKTIDPDGKEFLEINLVVNLWTKNKFIFDILLGENSNVKIYNLSNVNGAGLLFSRQLESAGLRVVEVSSGYSQPVEGKGCVFKSDGVHFYTEFLLRNYMGCKNISTKKEIKTGEEGTRVWLL